MHSALLDVDAGGGPATALPGPLGPWSALLDALQAGPGAQACLSHIDQARRALLGPGLLTVSLHDPDAASLQRVWSSDPHAYPVGGRKHKPDSPWARQVLQRCEVFVAEGDAAIRAAFDDHARIASLGLRSAINVPLGVAGRCLATFNVLRPHGTWPAADQAIVRLLALAAMPAMLQSAGVPAAFSRP